MSEFFFMDGHAAYVWGSVGMCVFALWLEMMVLRHRRRSLSLRFQRGQLDDDAAWETLP